MPGQIRYNEDADVEESNTSKAYPAKIGNDDTKFC